jgi:hypothetical protein
LDDQFDVTLEDADLLNEVELTTNLIVAAGELERHLTGREIDQVLDVVPQPAHKTRGLRGSSSPFDHSP